jgi:Ca2+-binding RTX toxin-like protein
VDDSSTEGIDKIYDFVVGSDRLLISHNFPGDTVLDAGVIDPSLFALGSSATNTSQRFIYNNASGGLFFDADGLGGVGQVRIAQFVGNPALTNASLFVPSET